MAGYSCSCCSPLSSCRLKPSQHSTISSSHFSWFRKDNFHPVTEQRGVLQADGSLYFVKTKIQDSGVYVCVVNNTAGEQILESTLTVTG